MSIVEKLTDIGVIQKGEFVLKSGKKSNVYFDLKKTISYPLIMKEICEELMKYIDKDCAICGVPMAGIPFASILSVMTDMPMILVRNDKKEYGMCKQIEGDNFGKNVVLIEDVITTGSSVLNTIEILEKNNIFVKQIVCILDRQDNNLADKGYEVVSLLKMSDIL